MTTVVAMIGYTVQYDDNCGYYWKDQDESSLMSSIVVVVRRHSIIIVIVCTTTASSERKVRTRYRTRISYRGGFYAN